MASSSLVIRLVEIIEAIELVEAELTGVSLEQFERDKRKRWIVERGLEIISEASRRLPDALKQRQSHIPWPRVAAIGNVLRHEYHRIAHDLLWHLVFDELPQLEEVCRIALHEFQADDEGRS